jgi:hypothetical protein
LPSGIRFSYVAALVFLFPAAFLVFPMSRRYANMQVEDQETTTTASPVKAKVMLTGTLVSSAVTLTLAVILFISFWFTWPVENHTYCDDGNVCTFDLYRVPGFCEYKPKDKLQKCTSNCYNTSLAPKLTCDGLGSCVGAPEACLSRCSLASFNYEIWDDKTLCDASLFPIRDYFVIGQGSYGEDRADDLGNTYCFAEQCVHISVSLELTSDLSSWWDSWAMAHMNCSDLLDPTADVFPCIVSSSFELDSTFLSSYFKGLFSGSEFYKARVCVFRHACGAFNNSIFSESINLASTEASTTTLFPHHTRLSRALQLPAGVAHAHGVQALAETAIEKRLVRQLERRRRSVQKKK